MATIEIPCTGSGGEVKIALADKADELLLAGFTWRWNQPGSSLTPYAETSRNDLYLSMHRLIIGAPVGVQVDHINRNGLDNRRANLRLATRSQNHANRESDRRQKPKTSRFKGVSWSKSKKRWVAYITVEGRHRSIGAYTDEVVAAMAYDRAAEAAWGEYARLNL